jgi:hypothetical protein
MATKRPRTCVSVTRPRDVEPVAPAIAVRRPAFERPGAGRPEAAVGEPGRGFEAITQLHPLDLAAEDAHDEGDQVVAVASSARG